MSDLLNSASLVMIPSGYKEDTVFSAIPTDGSGDLSFTRASNGTRVKSAGLVEVTPWNFLEQSEALDNAAWTSINTTETIGATAPDGTATAWTLSKSAASGRLYQVPSVISGTVTFSVYAKAGTTNQVSLETGNSFRTLDLSTGSLVSGGVGNYNIESVGNGWYRFSIVDSAYSGVAIYVSPTANTSGNILVWHPQYNIGSTAKPYFPTTDRLNVPRLTYQNGGGGCPSLLLEKQSTNLFTYSEQIDNAAWFYNNLTITANQAISPDGTQNADLLDDGTASSTQHWIYQGTSFSNSTAYTISFYAKYVSRQYMTVNIYNGSTSQYVDYDIQNGTILGSTGDVTASITSVGNGWYRIVYTRTMAASGSPNFRIGLADDTGSETYTGSNKQVYVWGFQCEASSYATSYIPTTSASATRVADACSKTGISSLIGQTSGTLFFEGAQLAAATCVPFQLSDTTNANRVQIEIGSTGAPLLVASSGGVTQAVIIGSSYTYGQNRKIAVTYKNNDFRLFQNGVLIGSDTSGSVPLSLTAVYLGSEAGTPYLDLQIKQIVNFKTSLTDAECIALTTL
jgi:hypothetical protein